MACLVCNRRSPDDVVVHEDDPQTGVGGVCTPCRRTLVENQFDSQSCGFDPDGEPYCTNTAVYGTRSLTSLRGVGEVEASESLAGLDDYLLCEEHFDHFTE